MQKLNDAAGRSVSPALLLGFFIVHFLLIWVAAQTPLIRSFDTLFDLDQLPQIQRWIEFDSDRLRASSQEAEFFIRHPGGYLPRFIFRPLIALGMSVHGAIALVLSLGAAASLWLIGYIAHRKIASPSGATSCAIAMILLNSSYLPFWIVETFTFSYLFILAAFAELSRSNGVPTRLFAVLSAAAAMITITNGGLLLCGLVGFAISNGRSLEWRALGIRLKSFVPIILAAGLVSVFSALYFVNAEALFSFDGVRRSYWIAASPEKAGLLDLAFSFTVFSIVAPSITVVGALSSESGSFADYRIVSYSIPAALACAGGFVLWSRGIWCVLRSKDACGITAIAWTGFNLLLHLVWQSKGSVFLFSMHVAPALIYLAINGWPGRTSKLVAVALVIWLALFLSVNMRGNFGYITLDPLIQVARKDDTVMFDICSRKDQLLRIPGVPMLWVSLVEFCAKGR